MRDDEDRKGRSWSQREIEEAEAWLLHFGILTAERVAAMNTGEKYYSYLSSDRHRRSPHIKQVGNGQWINTKSNKELFVVSNLRGAEQTLDQLLRIDEVIDEIEKFVVAANGGTKFDESLQQEAIDQKWDTATDQSLSFLKEMGLIPGTAVEFKIFYMLRAGVCS